MSNLQNQDVYLIVCEGQGDIDVGLVNQETWDWIISPYESDENSYKETVPNSVFEAYPKSEYKTQVISITIGSYENDRALQGPKFSFESIKEAMKFIKKNNCNLVDEFYGCIY